MRTKSSSKITISKIMIYLIKLDYNFFNLNRNHFKRTLVIKSKLKFNKFFQNYNKKMIKYLTFLKIKSINKLMIKLFFL